MEPSAALKRRRVVSGSVVLAVVVGLSGCRRAGEVPARVSAPPPPPAREEDFEETRAPQENIPPAADRGQVEPQAAPQPAEPAGPFQPGGEQTPEPVGDEPGEAAPMPQREPAAEAEEEGEGAESEPPLPPPLVDDPEGLQRLHPSYPVWIDRDRKHVVMVGRVCQRRAPLELFACLRGSKEHESVVVVDTKAYVVHAGLLATGAEPGGAVQFVPEFVPPSGPEVELTVVWEDQWGRRRSLRGQDWVQDVAELYAMFEGVVANPFDEELNVYDQVVAWKEMESAWVFAGSQLLADDRTSERYYQADVEGDLICVSNFPSAVLDVPIRSTDSNAALLFEAFAERIPPLGTPVTLILTPKLE